MIKKNSVVLYKNDAALVTDSPSGGKFPIQFPTQKAGVYSTQNVREKDVVLLHEGPASSLKAVLDKASSADFNMDGTVGKQLAEAHELLLSDEATSSSPIEFSELVQLFYGDFSADEAYALYALIRDTLYFSASQKDYENQRLVFIPRSQKDIDAIKEKADQKGKEEELRAAFIQRLKQKQLIEGDSKYMVDVESLALGKTDKSRTMHDAHMKETPERAHKLLLDTGIWKITRNPYPYRWGLSMHSASESLASPPEEERLEVEGVSYAIDNEWSTDPDDAVAFDGKYLWVHIADPASTVMPDSSIDKVARERGSTLYIPEGASRMLCEESLEDYALGLTSKSRALSFRLELNDDGTINDCQIFKTHVNVKRLTYQEADTLKESPELKPLFDIAEKNEQRRKKSGAVQIQMPEVNISVDPDTKNVTIKEVVHPQSSAMIREMMLLAGEGAARFAFQNGIPFPFVSQEEPDRIESVPEGLAGQYRLRRCMHRRSVGVTPSMHCGLGLAMYSQVTSPLRRYGDLIAHMQLRAFLDKRQMLDKDTMLLRVAMGEEASQAAHKAERKSNMHWTLVYLLQNPEWTGKAVCLDTSQKLPLFSIPSLALEVNIAVNAELNLNQEIDVKVSSINLPELTVEFKPV
ncbi:MAG: RNB domain-containing ribonuclease [Treponema sp.]|nr:RNB domain-containing ribonuclease [Treponema sp.]MBR7079037.1 RNB domain-containing ribonuclease [Treponema sp.]